MKQEMEDLRTEMRGERNDESKETKCIYLYQKTRKDCLDPIHSPVGDPELGSPPPTLPSQGVYSFDLVNYFFGLIVVQ